MRLFPLFFSSDPSIEFYPKKYCDIVKDVTQPTCLETSILELWANDGNFTNQKTKDKVGFHVYLLPFDFPFNNIANYS